MPRLLFRRKRLAGLLALASVPLDGEAQPQPVQSAGWRGAWSRRRTAARESSRTRINAVTPEEAAEADAVAEDEPLNAGAHA